MCGFGDWIVEITLLEYDGVNAEEKLSLYIAVECGCESVDDPGLSGPFIDHIAILIKSL